jgi:hypothetical protein
VVSGFPTPAAPCPPWAQAAGVSRRLAGESDGVSAEPKLVIRMMLVIKTMLV